MAFDKTLSISGRLVPSFSRSRQLNVLFYNTNLVFMCLKLGYKHPHSCVVLEITESVFSLLMYPDLEFVEDVRGKSIYKFLNGDG